MILLTLTLTLFCIDITFVWLHPYLIKNIIKTIDEFNIDPLKFALIYYVLMWFMLLILGCIEDISALYSTERIGKNIKRGLLSYINKHSMSYFKENIGQVVISKVNDVTQGCGIVIKDLLISLLIFVFTQIIVFFTLYRANCLLFYYSFGATLIYLLTIYLVNLHTKPAILEL